MNDDIDVIAIDGPAGSGKSTVAKQIARELGWDYIDTGAMYRCICLKAFQEGIDIEHENRLVDELDGLSIRITFENGDLMVYMGGRNVTDAIRDNRVSRHVSEVAQISQVREKLVKKQREMGKRGEVVMDGRDIGTVVFPDARYKFYLDAPLEVRAQRRYNELIEKGEQVNYESVVKEMKHRDETDRERSDSPLKPAEDAIHVDTSDKSVQEVVNKLLNEVGEQPNLTE